jgi:hypothetical protein
MAYKLWQTWAVFRSGLSKNEPGCRFFSTGASSVRDTKIREGETMRYMMLIYTKEGNLDLIAPEEAEHIRQGHVQVMTETRKRGILVAVNPLGRTSSATTVRVENGKTLATDGPFAETKEQLAGYYVLDCQDLDEAIAWAAQIPTSCGGVQGSIEIRPLREIPGVPESVLRSNAEIASV